MKRSDRVSIAEKQVLIKAIATYLEISSGDAEAILDGFKIVLPLLARLKLEKNDHLTLPNLFDAIKRMLVRHIAK